MLAPPSFAGGSHLSVTSLLPAVAVKFLGAPGVVAVARGVTANLAAGLVTPSEITARTKNVYLVPLRNPLNVWLVWLDAGSQVKPLSIDTS